jgi:hypothetical protein
MSEWRERVEIGTGMVQRVFHSRSDLDEIGLVLLSVQLLSNVFHSPMLREPVAKQLFEHLPVLPEAIAEHGTAPTWHFPHPKRDVVQQPYRQDDWTLSPADLRRWEAVHGYFVQRLLWLFCFAVELRSVLAHDRESEEIGALTVNHLCSQKVPRHFSRSRRRRNWLLPKYVLGHFTQS